MRVRLPLIIALVMVVLGAGGYLFGPPLWHTWQHHREREHDAAVMRKLKPAMNNLAAMQVPDGFTSCATADVVRGSGGICWKSEVSPPAAAAALSKALQSISATDITARCVDNRVLGNVCAVGAKVSGSPFYSDLGPQLDPKPGGGYLHHGVFVAGGVLLGVPGLPAGNPVPVPSS